MKTEKLLRAIGKINDELVYVAAPKQITEDIESAAKYRTRYSLTCFWRTHKAAAWICVVLLSASVTFGTAFASSATFRQAVISIFFPIYSNNEIREIADGHMTGSFDERNTLFTFLDKFNNEKMEEGLTAKKDDGYEYTLLPESEDSIMAIVECGNSDYKLLVMMERKEYEETTGLWQVVAYQVIDAQTANDMMIGR